MSIFNVRLKRVGGIYFLTLGRLNFSFCVSRCLNKCFEAANQ